MLECQSAFSDMGLGPHSCAPARDGDLALHQAGVAHNRRHSFLCPHWLEFQSSATSRRLLSLDLSRMLTFGEGQRAVSRLQIRSKVP